MPAGIRPPWNFLKYSELAAAGQTPTPLMVKNSSVSAQYTMMGATPPKLAISLSTTLRARPAATPASTALPARLEHLESGLRGEVVASDDHVPGAHDGGPMRLDQGGGQGQHGSRFRIRECWSPGRILVQSEPARCDAASVGRREASLPRRGRRFPEVRRGHRVG